MRRLVILVLASLSLIGLGAAGAVAAASIKLHVLSQVCVATKSRAVTAPTRGHCPAGTLLEAVGTTKVGKTGATGPSGPAGPAGAAGPQGAPASAKTYIVNWKRGQHVPVNAYAGVVLSGGPFDDAGEHSEDTTWEFPVDVTNCALGVSTASQSGLYLVEGGPPPGPIAQAGRNSGDPRTVYVDTAWPGSSAGGTDFSLLVTCP
jgi:hypothetical protein